jgi:hypothetical protein
VTGRAGIQPVNGRDGCISRVVDGLGVHLAAESLAAETLPKSQTHCCEANTCWLSAPVSVRSSIGNCTPHASGKRGPPNHERAWRRHPRCFSYRGAGKALPLERALLEALRHCTWAAHARHCATVLALVLVYTQSSLPGRQMVHVQTTHTKTIPCAIFP